MTESLGDVPIHNIPASCTISRFRLLTSIHALCKQRKFPQSLDALTKANKLLPQHPRIIHLLGWAVFMNGDADRGRKLMKQALKTIPLDVQMLCDLAILEIQQGNGKEAKEYAVKANEIDPSNHLAQEVFMKVVAFDKERARLIRNTN